MTLDVVGVCGSISRGSAFVCAFMCVCVFVHPHARMHVVGSFCCICTDVGFSICRLCCYCCVSMEALTHIAALKN